MAKHWCGQHQVAFFKRGNMKGYAHPLKDEDGEDTGEWCNEPKEEAEEKPSTKRDSSTNASIETQVAFKGIVELTAAGVILIDDPKYLTAMNWAMSKLGNWASAGSPPTDTEKPPTEPMSTKEQRTKILSTYKERGYSDSLALSVMIRLFGVSESKKLTKKQASEFIKVLESGKYLEELSQEDVSDIPF